MRPADASSFPYNLYLHATDMRAGEAWVAVGDRVAYTIAKNEGKTGPHRIAIKAVKCADVVVLERAGGGADAPPPPPPGRLPTFRGPHVAAP